MVLGWLIDDLRKEALSQRMQDAVEMGKYEGGPIKLNAVGAAGTAGAVGTEEVAFILTPLRFLVGGCLVMFRAAGFAMLERWLRRADPETPGYLVECCSVRAVLALVRALFWDRYKPVVVHGL